MNQTVSIEKEELVNGITFTKMENEHIVLRNETTGKVSLPINSSKHLVEEIMKDVLFLANNNDDTKTILFTKNMTCLRSITILDHKVIGDNLLYINCGFRKHAFLKAPFMQTTGWIDVVSYEVVNRNLILFTDSKGRTKSFKPVCYKISDSLSASDIALLRNKTK